MPCYGDTLCDLCSRPLLDADNYNCPMPWVDTGEIRQQTDDLLQWMTEIYALYPGNELKELTSEADDPGQMGLWTLKDDSTISISFRRSDAKKERIYGVHKYCYDFFKDDDLDPYFLIDNFWCKDAINEDYTSGELNQEKSDKLWKGNEYEGQFYKFDKAYKSDKWLLEKPIKENRIAYDFLLGTRNFLEEVHKTFKKETG